MAVNKKQLLKSINVQSEAIDLLGSAKKGKYHCFRKDAHKNNDASPSLTMNQDGFWACHTCGAKGDIFQLYMDVKGVPKERFAEVISHFASKYGVDMTTTIAVRKNKGAIKKRKQMGSRQAKQIMQGTQRDLFNPKYGGAVLDWLKECYGISADTAREWGLGWSTQSSRLFFPIPVKNLWAEEGVLAPLVNVRKHDLLRYHCNWKKYKDGKAVLDATGTHETSKRRPAEVERIRGEWVLSDWLPKWDGAGGKVFGVRGHNAVYLYPMSAFQAEGDIWLVGGENKMLMMRERGINSITFTSGEANYSKDLCELFHGRNVRIVYDIDEAGQRGSMIVGRAIADAGGNVKVGVIPSEGLPKDGDITDYMRKHGWDIACLSAIKWRDVEPEKVVEKLQAKKITYQPVSFSSLIDGEYLDKYIEVPAIVSGKGITPYAVPYSVAAKCKEGEANQQPKCSKCSLSSMGFMTPNYPESIKLSGERVVDMTGLPKSLMPKAVRESLGINPKCSAAQMKIKHATVDRIVIVPTVDKTQKDEQYRHQQVYLITNGKSGPRENEGYILSGKLIGDPKNHAFTMAALKSRPVEGDVFSYKFSNEDHGKLREALWTDSYNAQDVMQRVIADLKDNVLFKYGMDTMLMVELLSWFMPFEFSIGAYHCHKVCPEVLVIGDTRVGKSTTATDLGSHLGAGRYVDCGANPTFVGLVGGNTDIGSTRVFTWGVVPTTNRGHLTMDEANKLSLQTWGGLTNIKSSGIASRQTNSGDRKTRANVRFLTLCNPRGSRSLGAYDTPLDAAIEVVGTPQDLARIDLLYVARALKDTGVYNMFHERNTAHHYTKEIARHHLRWAWNLKAKTISFASPEHVLHKSNRILTKTQGVMMIAPSEAKFKIGRLAVAIASLVYSYDKKTGGVKVTNEHVDLAYNMLKQLYTTYMKNAGIKTGIIPESVRYLFDKVRKPKMLRILATSDTWAQQDFVEIFGVENAGKFKFEAQLEHGLMTRRRAYFTPVEGFQDLIRDYVNMRLEG